LRQTGAGIPGQRLLIRITLATPNVVIPESIITIGRIITGLHTGSSIDRSRNLPDW